VPPDLRTRLAAKLPFLYNEQGQIVFPAALTPALAKL
jgi:hypothetical protein